MVKTKQIKTCRKKRHVRIDSMKEMPNLICGKGAVGENYNSTRDNQKAMDLFLSQKSTLTCSC